MGCVTVQGHSALSLLQHIIILITEMSMLPYVMWHYLSKSCKSSHFIMSAMSVENPRTFMQFCTLPS